MSQRGVSGQLSHRMGTSFDANANERGLAFMSTTGVTLNVKSPAVTFRDQLVKLPAREIKWTILDEERLNSVEYLHRKSRECHSSVHSLGADFQSQLSRQRENNDDSMGLHNRPILKYVFFHPKENKPEDIDMRSVGMQETSAFFASNRFRSGSNDGNATNGATRHNRSLPLSVQQRAQNGVLWISVIESDFIDVVLRQYNVHSVFINYFHDTRPHSSFLESDMGFLISICSCSLQNDDRECRLQKFYVFVTAGLCITFERNLTPSMNNTSNQHIGASTEFVSSALMSRAQGQPQMAALYGSQGAPYLMFELLTENIRLQSSLFQFCSVTIFYFKNLIRMNDEDLFDGNIDRRVRVVESCLVMLEKHTDSSWKAMQQLSSGHRLLLSKNGKFGGIFASDVLICVAAECS
jgi:hypothetical protein